MLTPQQIDQISFGRATFGGYDMQDVDDFLTPLTEDYVTLYKENALLKSKMRVLVSKLEEYRKNEASMKEAIINAQKTCDKMVRDAEVKAAQMLANANDAAMANAANAANTDAMVAAEDARVEEARKVAAAKIDEIQEQLRSCIQALDRIKSANAPAEAPAKEMDVADEIAQNLQAIVGTTHDVAPKAEPKHPGFESTTSRFANMNLQFGRNYDADHK
ncbi:MAG: DivIVA domain-containing protein [Ruminococcaceae bacterium]|nr:DivIVA domain-containing protein [Oscillospiraceae bacterium]